MSLSDAWLKIQVESMTAKTNRVRTIARLVNGPCGIFSAVVLTRWPHDVQFAEIIRERTLVEPSRFLRAMII